MKRLNDRQKARQLRHMRDVLRKRYKDARRKGTLTFQRQEQRESGIVAVFRKLLRKQKHGKNRRGGTTA